MATTSSFGVLTEFGDTGANTIVTSHDGTGRILINNGAVPTTGGTPIGVTRHRQRKSNP